MLCSPADAIPGVRGDETLCTAPVAGRDCNARRAPFDQPGGAWEDEP